MQVVIDGNMFIPMLDGIPTIHHTTMEQRWDATQCARDWEGLN